MKRKVKRALLIAGIFALAVFGAVGLSQMKPPPDHRDIADIDPLVQVLPLVASDIDFTIATY